jgi:hypothetical protein
LFRFVGVSESTKSQILSDKAKDPNFKGVFGAPKRFILYSNQQKPKENRNVVSKEMFVSVPTVVYVKKDFYLLEAFNKKIEAFKSGALAKIFVRSVADLCKISI